MADFRGYLFKATKNDTVFPHEYIIYGTWSSQPNNREELKSIRNDNSRDLVRVTAKGKKSTFSFTLRGGLHLNDIQKIKNFFERNIKNEAQRKIELKYWNDEDLAYHTSDFYVPNYTPKIRSISPNDIIYDDLDLSFVEY